jgi:hypothetical protein
MDRYDGVYSGAKWLAIHEDPAHVPQEIGGEDLDEQGFWLAYNNQPNSKPIGKGETPDNAYKDLLKKIIEWYKSDMK